MKIRIIQLLMLIYLLTSSSCTSDIRTKFMRDSKIDKNILAKKGRDLLLKSAKLHGYINFKKINTYEVDFEDQYYGIFKYLANPYPNTINKFKLNYIPLTFDGKLEFLDGKWKNTVWGIQQWNIYIGNSNSEEYNIQSNKDIRFWLPTYQYFIEMPFRLMEGDKCSYAGNETIFDVVYDLVFVTWNSYEPQNKIDQYLVWINQQSGLIDFVEFTVRDESRLITAVAEYKDYHEFKGVLFPSTIGVKLKMSSKQFMHKMKLNSIRFNTVSKASLNPFKTLHTNNKY